MFQQESFTRQIVLALWNIKPRISAHYILIFLPSGADKPQVENLRFKKKHEIICKLDVKLLITSFWHQQEKIRIQDMSEAVYSG